jgi:hypothetical protein
MTPDESTTLIQKYITEMIELGEIPEDKRSTVFEFNETLISPMYSTFRIEVLQGLDIGVLARLYNYVFDVYIPPIKGPRRCSYHIYTRAESGTQIVNKCVDCGHIDANI